METLPVCRILFIEAHQSDVYLNQHTLCFIFWNLSPILLLLFQDVQWLENERQLEVRETRFFSLQQRGETQDRSILEILVEIVNGKVNDSVPRSSTHPQWKCSKTNLFLPCFLRDLWPHFRNGRLFPSHDLRSLTVSQVEKVASQFICNWQWVNVAHLPTFQYLTVCNPEMKPKDTGRDRSQDTRMKVFRISLELDRKCGNEPNFGLYCHLASLGCWRSFQRWETVECSIYQEAESTHIRTVFPTNWKFNQLFPLVHIYYRHLAMNIHC